LIFEILDPEQGIPSKRKSAVCVDDVHCVSFFTTSTYYWRKIPVRPWFEWKIKAYIWVKLCVLDFVLQVQSANLG